MRELVGTAKILVMVSHNLDLVRELCSRVILLEHGRVVADGEPAAVMRAARRCAPMGRCDDGDGTDRR